jgi:hypothetical protein
MPAFAGMSGKLSLRDGRQAGEAIPVFVARDCFALRARNDSKPIAQSFAGPVV